MATSTESARSSPGIRDASTPRPALFAPPKALAELVTRRLSLVMKLGQLEDARRRLQQGGLLADAVLTELSRQMRELKRLPGAAKIDAARKRLDKRLTELEAPAAEDGENKEQAPRGLIEALRIGVRQSELLRQRDELTTDLLKTAAACLADQPLAGALSTEDAQPVPVVAWTVYGAALEMFADSTVQRLATLLPAEQAGPPAQRLEQLQAAIRREQQALEPVMVAAFWQAYEQAAVALIEGDLDEAAVAHVRAFLRVGLVAPVPWLIDPQTGQRILEQCGQPRRERDPRPEATHALYADEYLDLLAQGQVTPSFDQDLELNEKGSDRWKLDKRWRQAVWGRTIEPLLTHTCDDLRQRSAAQKAEMDELEAQLAQVQRSDKEYREKRERLATQVQERKVAVARMEQAIDLIETKHLIQQKELAEEAAAKLAKMESGVDPIDLIRREVKAIRHVCKLTARLKETFLPLQLRDRLRFDALRVNDRAALEREVASIEQRDPDVFRHIQVFAKKRENRTYVRFSPYMVIVPSLGVMAYAWNPRGGTEVGRLGFPLLNQRPGDLPRMLCHVLADFRFDTSKQDAGVDLLTSDTLVAAYATARWNWRKRPRDQREKAAIYNEENDRTNWRRHYELFVSSSLDGGKKLFFKNPEVYEAVLKYMGLPDGVEPMG